MRRCSNTWAQQQQQQGCKRENGPPVHSWLVGPTSYQPEGTKKEPTLVAPGQPPHGRGYAVVNLVECLRSRAHGGCLGGRHCGGPRTFRAWRGGVRLLSASALRHRTRPSHNGKLLLRRYALVPIVCIIPRNLPPTLPQRLLSVRYNPPLPELPPTFAPVIST